MAPHLSGTSPASRSATPTPPLVRNSSSAATGPRRSSIVPFIRPGSSGASEDGGQGSFKSSEDALQRISHSLQHRRTSSSTSRDLESTSLGDCSTSIGGLRRPEPRKSGQFARGSGFVRKEGFQTEQSVGSQEEGQKTSPRPPVSPHGLLSRQFSSDSLQPAAVPQKSSSDALKERLQKCYEKSPPALGESQEVDPGLLLRTLQLSFPIFQTTLVTRAFNIAKAAHVGSSAPLVRCAEVARTLADLEASEECVAAALLHSVLDSSMLTEEKLRMSMCAEVADTVCNVHKLSGICQMHKALVAAQGGISNELHASFQGMLLAMQDVPAVLIVLADSLQALRARPTAAAAAEALGVFAPLANRLGVWSIKADLEDLAFKILHPLEHAELQAKCEESLRRGSIEANLDQLKARLAQVNIRGDLSGRPKNLWGVYRKMCAKGYGLDQVYDVRALRVVVDSKSDCYEVLREVHRLWTPVEGRFKDYIRHKKDNGYQSLHTVVLGSDGVPMEVQIRTQKMHWIAEYGVAAHWRYKEAAARFDSAQEHHVAWFRHLISFQMELADKKCRPSGSPPRDSGFAALQSRICAFPEHDADCKFAEYFRRKHLAPQPPSTALASAAPVFVVVSDGRSGRAAGAAAVRIEQLPSGCTAGDLAQRLAEGRSSDQLHLRMLVNHKEVAGWHQVLEQCDRVEVFESAWAEADPLRLGLASDRDLEHSRQLLQRMFSRSGSLPADIAALGFQAGQPITN
ncbi:probable GTP diphosphokinase RSH3, chloroplastic [Coccomyxa sp. Obi]|nr:probable GTP diphosphokinase RSH3, chloroplastic [Coccomyxa sp. Obi]